jgi:glutaredoxin
MTERDPAIPIPDRLTVYGADCRRTRRFLDGAGIDYRYVDLTVDPRQRDVLEAAGYRAIPVVVTPDGQVMVEPSVWELEQRLGLR